MKIHHTKPKEVKPQELRLGNIVEWKGELCYVIGLNENMGKSLNWNMCNLFSLTSQCVIDGFVYITELTPLFLNRENMVLLGFEEWRSNEWLININRHNYLVHTPGLYWKDGSSVATTTKNALKGLTKGERSHVFARGIRYLHQLQNIIYSVSGVELKYKFDLKEYN